MTLILKLDLDMINVYLHTKNEVSLSSGSKVIALTDRNTQTDRQTDTQTDRQTHMTENITYPHTRVVITNERNKVSTGRERLIRSHLSARFCFELSGNSN